MVPREGHPGRTQSQRLPASVADFLQAAEIRAVIEPVQAQGRVELTGVEGFAVVLSEALEIQPVRKALLFRDAGWPRANAACRQDLPGRACQRPYPAPRLTIWNEDTPDSAGVTIVLQSLLRARDIEDQWLEQRHILHDVRGRQEGAGGRQDHFTQGRCRQHHSSVDAMLFQVIRHGRGNHRLKDYVLQRRGMNPRSGKRVHPVGRARSWRIRSRAMRGRLESSSVAAEMDTTERSLSCRCRRDTGSSSRRLHPGGSRQRWPPAGLRRHRLHRRRP